MKHNAYSNPGGLSGVGVINSPARRSAEVPSANAHGAARGITRVYAALCARAVPWATRPSWTPVPWPPGRLSTPPAWTWFWTGRPGSAWVSSSPSPSGRWARGQRGFGHIGAGGSLGFCDPENGVAFGYVMNQIGPGWQSPRARALVDAAYACL